MNTNEGDDLEISPDKTKPILNKKSLWQKFKFLNKEHPILMNLFYLLSIIMILLPLWYPYFHQDNDIILIPSADCGVFTSNMFQESNQENYFPYKEKVNINFSLNRQNDYFIDNFRLQVKKGYPNRLRMEVILPKNLKPAYFRSFPGDDKSDFKYVFNKEGLVENLAVEAEWQIKISPLDTKQLIIFYNNSEENEKMLKNNNRIYSFGSKNPDDTIFLDCTPKYFRTSSIIID